MKKFFLMAAAGLMATSAFSQKLVWEKDYSNGEWSYYVMGYTPEAGDGCIVSNNPMEGENGGPSWYQYFIADGIPTKVDESYSVVVECKASEAVTVGMNMGWGWGDGEVIGNSISIPTDWEAVEVNMKKPVGGTSCNVVLQPGTTTATIYIKSVKVYQNPPAAQYTTKDITTVDYTALSSYPYEDLGTAPVVADGVLSFPADGDMFYAMNNVTFVPDSLSGIKTKIKGSKAGTVQVSMGYWDATVVATIDVDEEWNEIELPIGVVPACPADQKADEGFVIILTKDEEAGLNYDGVLEMEYCTYATFTEIPPVVIPTEWVSIVGNCNANEGETKNLIDRDPAIDEGGIEYAADYTQANDCYAMICDNPAGEGKVYYCPIMANPQPGYNNSTDAALVEKWGEFQGVFDWSSQFFIYFDEALEAETNLKVSFEYYCSDERSISTQAHGLPGQYHHWECVGTLNAKPEWQTLAKEVEVASNWAGADGFHSIAFNLSNMDAAATFYINNVVVEIEKEVEGGGDAVKTVNAIILPAQGVYNFQGVKVANSIEEVTVPGMYISNGKKYVVK